MGSTSSLADLIDPSPGLSFTKAFCRGKAGTYLAMNREPCPALAPSLVGSHKKAADCHQSAARSSSHKARLLLLIERFCIQDHIKPLHIGRDDHHRSATVREAEQSRVDLMLEIFRGQAFVDDPVGLGNTL